MIVARALRTPRSFSYFAASRVSTEKFHAPSPASMISRAFSTVTPVPTEFINTNTPGCRFAARITSTRCGYSSGSPPLSCNSSMPSAAASSIVRNARSSGM